MAQYEFAVPNTLDNEEISVILERADTFVGWVNDVKEYALEQALSGQVFPGFKVVEGRSNRRYINNESVAEAVKNAGYDPYEKKRLGITAMTKLLGKNKFENIPKGKPTLVPLSDKRQIWTIDDFKEEINND